MVFDPHREELFTAERGEGALLNGSGCGCVAGRALIDSLLFTGFPYDVHAPSMRWSPCFGLLGGARAVRRLGSASMDLRWVAAGRLDGFWEERLQPWDTCAAALLVPEAGGHVTGLDGRAWNAAAGTRRRNGHLHEAMRQVVQRFRDRRPNKTV